MSEFNFAKFHERMVTFTEFVAELILVIFGSYVMSLGTLTITHSIQTTQPIGLIIGAVLVAVPIILATSKN